DAEGKGAGPSPSINSVPAPSDAQNLLLNLPEADAGTSAIGINEFDTGGFKGAPKRTQIRGNGLAILGLEICNCPETDTAIAS
ncbi:MAG TPA: hypothetical protein VIJ94_13140, partial [Caulobacteraceae bacterium]